MTASIALSGTRTTRPRWARASDASVTCSSPEWAPAHRPAIPSWTVDGVFGIARTTGTPSARYRSTVAVGVAAAIVRTVCSGAIAVPISLEQRLDVLRLHREDDERGARGGLDIARRRLHAVPLHELRDALVASRRRRELGRLTPAGGEEPGDQRFADPPGAEDRDTPLVDHGRHYAALRARRRAMRAPSTEAPGTSPRAQPSSSTSHASPCHSSYGASSAAVSSPSTQRPVSDA